MLQNPAINSQYKSGVVSVLRMNEEDVILCKSMK